MMTSFHSLTPAQNRERYFGVRFRSPKAMPTIPRLHPDNPTLLNEPDDAINQLHSSHQGFPLKVQIDRFAEAGDPGDVEGYLELRWDGTLIRASRVGFITPVDVSKTEFDLVLPQGYTSAPGPHKLDYELNFGGNRTYSTVLDINIDTTPPVAFGMAVVPDEVLRDGITKKYLDDNGSVLVTIPNYGSRKIGDIVECFLGAALPNPTLIGQVTITDATTPITFDLTPDKVGTEEGLRAIFYYLSDRKGNRNTPQYYLELNVTLTDPPQGLVAPSIPLFDDDADPKLVDLADAQAPLGVGILAEYTNYLEGVDELEVTFDGIKLPAQKINGFPFYVDVPYRTVHNGNLHRPDVPVGYQIKRNNMLHPSSGPLTKLVDVDLRRPGDGDGGENPDPTLALVTVQGQVSTGPNILTKDDSVGTVKVTVAVFAGVKDGDIMTLVWKGVEVTEAQGGVIKLDGTETGDLTFDVLWEVVNAGGNGKLLPVSYKITNPAVNDNESNSGPREVDVLIRDAHVPEVKFQHLDPDFTEWFNCFSLRDDAVLVKCAEVLVADGQPQLAGQALEFVYQGYTDRLGTNPKPGTDEKVSYTPTAQEAVAGFIVKIPYQKILATESAWGAISYTAMIDGRPETSERHLVRIHMKNGDGSVCAI